MNIPDHVKKILRRLSDAGYEACLVGGCVRDMLSGEPPHDWDIASSSTPEETRQVFSDSRVLDVGLSHGTVAVLCGREAVEITTFRTEGTYSDHRRPDSVAFVRDLRTDLSRRDFTVNAMAMSADGHITDPFGGVDDLKAGVIRCVGNPEERFGEDALRILRAIRFVSKTGFSAEEKTARAMLSCSPLLQNISSERIFSELCGILTGRNAGHALEKHASVLAVVLPEIKPSFGFEQHSRYHRYDVWTHTVHAVQAVPASVDLRAAMLFHDLGKPFCFSIGSDGHGHFCGHAGTSRAIAEKALTRLRCPNALRDRILTLVAHHDDRLPRSEAEMRRRAARLGADTLRALFAMQRADAAAQAEWVVQNRLSDIDTAERMLGGILSTEECLSLSSLAVNGRDIMALGVPQGPQIGRVLDLLMRRVLDDPSENEREKLLRAASELLSR